MVTPAAIVTGFVLDWLFGDPAFIPHMVVGIGKMIVSFENGLRGAFLKSPYGELSAGAVLAVSVPVFSMVLCWLPLVFLGWGHPLLRYAAESFICWQCLAARSLAQAGNVVQAALEGGSLADAREAVGRIVGRDTAELERDGIIRAAVETVAENTCDGVIAPLFWMAVGGVPLGVFYKAVNTLDSMVGYTNAKYFYFGRASARLDDAMNFIPARLGALLMIAAARLCKMDYQNAKRIFLRDRLNHKSPNSAHGEAVCAGALGIGLGGDAVYFGKTVKKPTIGDALHEREPQDIARAVRLMFCTAWLGLAGALSLRGAILIWTILT